MCNLVFCRKLAHVYTHVNTLFSAHRNGAFILGSEFAQLHGLVIKPPFDRWLLLRAEQYVTAFPASKLKDYQPSDVTTYLGEIGRRDELTDRNFR